MTTFARTERTALLDTLRELGPEAATLCQGWSTADLAGHLAARERRPESVIGLLVPGLGEWAEGVRLHYARMPYDRLLGLLRVPPWW
ncbi:MAG: maleylpyruvate isomerase N-terminal domain-containing protein, partial [Stackebrandtia sp.]